MDPILIFLYVIEKLQEGKREDIQPLHWVMFFVVVIVIILLVAFVIFMIILVQPVRLQ